MARAFGLALWVLTLLFAWGSSADVRSANQIKLSTGTGCPVILGDKGQSPILLRPQTYPEAWLVFARLPKDQILVDGIPNRLDRDFYERALDAVLEVQSAIRHGIFRIDFTGRPKVQFDPSTGSPDFATYRLIRRLIKRAVEDYPAIRLAPEVKQILPILDHARQASYDEMWSTP